MLWPLHCSLILGGRSVEKGFMKFLSRQMAEKMVEMGKEGVFFCSVKTYFARRYNFWNKCHQVTYFLNLSNVGPLVYLARGRVLLRRKSCAVWES